MKRYRTIVADPPWRYEEKLRMGTGAKHKGPANQYGCMNYADIRALPVADLAEDDAHLYLWVTNAFLVEGHDLARAWGFEPRAVLTWTKPGIGTGPFFRTNTEHILFGLRGRLALASKSLPTGFSWPRGAHSAKPDAFYDLVEQASPGPYLEMFARRARLGDWHYWGDQSLGTVEMAA